MKRTLFLLLLSMVPLVWLTVGAIRDFIEVPASELPNDTGILEHVAAQLSKTRSKRPQVDAATELLVDTDILLPPDVSRRNALGEVTDFHALQTALQQWGPCAEDIQRYLNLLEQFRSHDIVQLRRTFSEFQRFQPEFAQKLPKDAGTFSRMLENQVNELEHYVTVAEKKVEATQLLTEARNSFDEQKYTIARDRCNQLLADYADVLEKTVQLDLIRLKARAEVHVGADQLGEWKLQQMTKEERLAKADEFIKALEEADTATLTDEERRMYETFQAEAGKLRTELTQQQAAEEIRTQANELQDMKNATLDEVLAKAADVCQKIKTQLKTLKDSSLDKLAQQELRSELNLQKKRSQTMVQNFISGKLPELKSKLPKGLQEAELKNGGLKYGYFRAVEQNGNVTGFKYYATLQEFENPTASVGTYSVDDFLKKPQQATELRIVAEYNALRKNLLEHLDSHGTWLEFARKCKTLNQQLTALKKTPEAQRTPKLSLRGAQQTAEAAVSEQNQKNWRAIFGK